MYTDWLEVDRWQESRGTAVWRPSDFQREPTFSAVQTEWDLTCRYGLASTDGASAEDEVQPHQTDGMFGRGHLHGYAFWTYLIRIAEDFDTSLYAIPNDSLGKEVEGRRTAEED